MMVVFAESRSHPATEERWTHIRERHPEMDSQKLRVLETVEAPTRSRKAISVKCRRYASIPGHP
jgi:hypothetical protein